MAGELDEQNKDIESLDEELRWILLDQYNVSRETAALLANKGFGSIDMMRHMGDTRAEVVDTLKHAAGLGNESAEERKTMIQLL